MPTLDYVNINQRERPLSTDLVAIQQIIGRIVADTLRFNEQRELYPVGSGNISVAPRDWVSGLSVSASASSTDRVTLAPGVLCQYSDSLSPSPGSYDSPCRLAFVRTSLELILPSGPIGSFWYLLEVRASQQVAASENRDILNAVTGVAEATLVPKVYETQLEVQWTQGTSTTMPAPNGGTWVAIAGVKFGNSGGVPVHAGDTAQSVLDVRPLLSHANFEPSVRDRAPHITHLQGMGDGTTASELTEAAITDAISGGYTDLNMHLWTATSGGLNLGSSAGNARASGLVTAGDTWYYLYMCPWAGFYAPRLGGGTGYAPYNVVGRGIPVLSSVVPDARGKNSSSINLYDPWGGVVSSGWARCIAALHRNTNNTGWTPFRGSIGKMSFFEDILGVEHPILAETLSGGASLTLPIAWARIPALAKRVNLRLETYVNGAVAAGDARLLVIARRPSAGPILLSQEYMAHESGVGRTYQLLLPEVPVRYGEGIEISLSKIGTIADFLALTAEITSYEF